MNSPGQIAQLARALSDMLATVVGLIPHQETYKKQPVNA